MACRTRATLGLCAAIGMALGEMACGATYTWTGGGGSTNRNWSFANNWGGSAPGKLATDDLRFGTSSIVTSLVDGSGSWSLNSITFNSGAYSYAINNAGGSSAPIQFAGATSSLTQNSSNDQTIQTNILLAAPTTFGGTGSGVVILGGTSGGALGGTGALTIAAGTFRFIAPSQGASNAFTGKTTIASGATAQVGTTGNPFGSGAIDVYGTLANSAGGTLAGINGSAIRFRPGSTLKLDYDATATANLWNGKALALDGSTLSLTHSAGGAMAEGIGALTFAGGSTVSIRSVSSPTSLSASSIARTGRGTLIVTDVTGTLTGNEIFTASGMSSLTTNGILRPYFLNVSGLSGTRDAGFLGYSGQFSYPTYSSSTNINTAAASAVFKATAVTTNTLNVDHTIYALRNDGRQIGGAYTLTIGDNNASHPAGVILNGGSITTSTLAFGGSEGIVYTSGANATISSTIAGTNGLTTFGPGILTLSGSVNLAGPITINSGTVNLANGASIPNASPITISDAGTLDVSHLSSAFSLASAQNLQGTGRVTGPITVTGTLSPASANATGTLTTGDQTWNSGGSYIWEINDAAGTGGAATGWDKLNMGGLTVNATAANTFTIKIVSLNGSASGAAANFNNQQESAWSILTHTAGLIFDASRFTLDTSSFTNALKPGWGFSLEDNGQDMRVRYHAVPEPATALVLVFCASGVLTRRRRPDPRAAREPICTVQATNPAPKPSARTFRRS